jgi:prepilin-type N-terminal cleavage/methylation domain-containing protein
MIHSKNKIFFHTNKKGFTLIETIIAIAVIAFVFGPLFVMQGSVLQRVVQQSRKLQRIFFMQFFAYKAEEQIKPGATQFNLEKKEEFPATILRYQLMPVDTRSSLKDIPGLHMQRVLATWEDVGVKWQDMLVSFTFIQPNEKKS